MPEIISNTDLFNRAIASEKLVQNFYLEMARKFNEEEEVKTIWKSLAEDEKKHAQVIEEIKDSLSQEVLNKLVDDSIVEKLVKIEKIRIREKIDKIDNLKDAYEFAHDVESSEINNLFTFITVKYFPDQIRKEFVLNEMTKHIDKLREIRFHLN